MYSSSSSVSANCTDGSSCAPSSQNAHIHFNLTWNGSMLSPSIFTDAIGKDLDEKLSQGSRHKDCSGPDCSTEFLTSWYPRNASAIRADPHLAFPSKSFRNCVGKILPSIIMLRCWHVTCSKKCCNVSVVLASSKSDATCVENVTSK